MKKLFLISFVLLSFFAHSQITPAIDQNFTGNLTKLILRGQLRVDSVIYVPLRDTNFVPARIGAIVVRPQDSSAYLGISVLSSPHWRSIGSLGSLTSSGTGFKLIKKGGAIDSIKTLAGTYTVALDSTSSSGTIILKLVNDVVSPGRNTIYHATTNASQTKGWGVNAWDSLFNKPVLNNYKKDSSVVYDLNVFQTVEASNWFRQPTFISASGEAIVSDGLQIGNTSSSLSNNVTYSDWKSVVGDVTTRAEYRLVSKNAGNAYLGVVEAGTTRGYSQWAYTILNVNTGQVQIFTAASTFLNNVGTISFTVNSGDVIQISFRRNFQFYTTTITDVTQNVTESFTRDDNAVGASPQVNNINPGIWIGNCTAVVRSFRHYVNNYNPDVMILGASIFQNAWLIPSFDSSFCGRLQAMSGRTIQQAGGSGETIDDMLDALREIVRSKPKVIVIGEIAYNNISLFGEATSVWQPKYKAFIDSLLQNGIKVVVCRLTPANNTPPTTINAFIDSVYTNSGKVIVFDMEHIRPAWDSTYAGNMNTHYFWDNLGHMNTLGAQVAATYMSKFLEQTFRYNIEGFNDVSIVKPTSNLRLITFDSLGIGRGIWRDRIMKGVTINGDTLNFNGALGGSVTNIATTPTVSPYFTTTVTNPTGAATINFTASTIAAHTVLSNITGGAAIPSANKLTAQEITSTGTANSGTWLSTDGSGNFVWSTPPGTNYTFPSSVIAPGAGIKLTNDSSFAAGAKGYYYGVDNSGNARLGYYNIASATQDTLVVRAPITFIPGTGTTPDSLRMDTTYFIRNNPISQQTSANFNIDGFGRLGTGDSTGTPSPSKLHSIFTNAASGTFINGIFRSNQTAATSGSIQALEGYTKTSNGAITNVNLSLATIGNAEHAGVGTVGRMSGGQFGLIANNSSGTITNAASVFVAPIQLINGATSTVTNSYGIFIDTAAKSTGTITNRWNIFTNDKLGKNEFNGIIKADSLAQQNVDTTTFKPVVANSSGVLSKGFWGTGAATSYTFNNGITNTSGTVQLGGNVIQHTTIDGVSNAFNYTVQNMAAIKLDATSTYITKRVTFDLIGPPLADYTVAGEGTYYLLLDLAGFASHTITLPTASATEKGRMLHLINRNTSGTNHWTFTTTVKDLTNTTVVTLPNSHDVVLTCDGSNWLMIQ